MTVAVREKSLGKRIVVIHTRTLCARSVSVSTCTNPYWLEMRFCKDDQARQTLGSANVRPPGLAAARSAFRAPYAIADGMISSNELTAPYEES